MNVWDSAGGQWTQSDPAFEITADGFVVSRRTQHRLTLAAQLNAAQGAVDLLAPDARRFRSTLLGLTLFNRQTGRSQALAELKSNPPSVGELVSSNACFIRTASTTSGLTCGWRTAGMVFITM